MKKLILLCLVFTATSWSAIAVAQSNPFKPGFLCSTEPFPTTIYRLAEDATGTWVNLDWSHFNGVEFAPFHEGIVVPNDLPILAQRADLIRALGTHQSFRFPRSGCESFGDRVIRCANYVDGPQVINGKKVRALSTYTSLSETQSFVGTYKTVSTTLFLVIDGTSLFVTMKYEMPNCRDLRP